MKDFLFMGLLVLLGGIILLSVISMFITKKIKIIPPTIVYTILSLFPVILVVIPVLLVSVSKGVSFDNIPLTVLRCIYSSEILLTLIVILIIVNTFPGSRFDSKDVVYTIKRIDSGVRLLQYSIFGNILYIIPSLLLVSYLTYLWCTVPNYGQTTPSRFYFLLLWGIFLFPTSVQLYAILIICIISILTLAVIFFIMSINGIIRITSAVIEDKKIRNIYIICMVLPILNIISMFFLCYIAKNKLKIYS